ncbi:hypothetical protein HEP81_07795 [Streptomyces griseofuscus]|uniref:Uncharacterized protein n=1 Tax=Streptomyces griseofuscus TaxID=146922 RepID=A0A7H1QCJ5_9ACTN|nr:hypothetical protein HEP81_07795 [Streptomyces griseofuscus]
MGTVEIVGGISETIARLTGRPHDFRGAEEWRNGPPARINARVVVAVQRTRAWVVQRVAKSVRKREAPAPEQPLA